LVALEPRDQAKSAGCSIPQRSERNIPGAWNAFKNLFTPPGL
jgi:hypothetical protein